MSQGSDACRSRRVEDPPAGEGKKVPLSCTPAALKPGYRPVRLPARREGVRQRQQAAAAGGGGRRCTGADRANKAALTRVRLDHCQRLSQAGNEPPDLPPTPAPASCTCRPEQHHQCVCREDRSSQPPACKPRRRAHAARLLRNHHGSAVEEREKRIIICRGSLWVNVTCKRVYSGPPVREHAHTHTQRSGTTLPY